ncbi:hypothetical protein AB0J52_13995 [Spirillospora sp. NPDC049652]
MRKSVIVLAGTPLALLGALAAGAAFVVTHRAAVGRSVEDYVNGRFDARRFDKLEKRFDDTRAAFVKAEARMRELAAARPHAEQVVWSGTLVCTREGGRPLLGDCKPTSPADRATFAALPSADRIVYQVKDPGRVFFRFYGEDPPRYTIMRAAEGTNLKAYAKERGFRTRRALEPGWTILGPISDVARETEQWD